MMYHRSGTTRARRFPLLGAAVAAFVLLAAASAQADTTPPVPVTPTTATSTAIAAPDAGAVATPDTTAVAAPDVSAQAKPARRAPARFEHLELTPTLGYTISTGSDIVPNGKGVSAIGKPAGNTLPLDVWRLTGGARWRFNNRWGLSFTRIAHTGAAGRVKPVPISVKNPLGGTFGGHSEDYEERFLVTDQMDRYFGARAGYAIRTRQCCPAAGAIGNNAPHIHTGFFSDINWKFGPNTIGGKPLTTSLRWEEYVHHSTTPTPINDEGTQPTFSFTLYSNFYFYHQTKLVPYYGIEYFSTYFSYSPQMSETYRKVYGLAYRATRDLSYKAYVKNDQSGGVLASSGDSAHKSATFVEMTYRIHR